VARFCRVPPASTGTFAQAAFRGNLAFIGLPVVIFAGAGRADAAITTAVYLLAAVVPFYNIAAVLVLVARREGLRSLRALPGQLLANPLILACVAAAVWAKAGPALPTWSARTLQTLADMALPLALLGIGATLRLEGIRGHWAAIGGAGALKVAVGPLLGWALARWLGLGLAETRAVLIFLACPTATVTFVMADQLGGDRSLAAGTVAASTIASFIPLSLILAHF
jgi:hypothetical protein